MTKSYESFAAEAKPILAAAVVLASLAALSFVIVSAFLPILDEGHEPDERHPMSSFRSVPTEPVLQANPYSELSEYRGEMRKRLESYGWVERQSGVIHIPLERALELAVERGLGEERGR